MKRKNIILVTLLIISGFFAMQSCKEDDTTFVTKQAFTTPVATSPEVRADGTVLFTGTTVDLKWNSENAGGDPVAWDVYFGTGKQPALYQSGVTANQITVPVVDGQKYNWRVEIKDERGVVTTSKINTFIAVNGLNPKIKVNLDCTTDVKDVIGVDMKPDDVVNLRMLIIKKSDMSIVSTVNAGKSSEVYEGFATAADGEYLIAVDIYSTLDAGDINKPINLSLTLDFFQLGMIDQTLEYSKLLTNEFVCSSYRVYLASVVKTGPAYVIAKEVSVPSNFLSGSYYGIDTEEEYDSQVEIYQGCASMIKGLCFEWLFDYWGEEIVEGGSAVLTIDEATKTLTIEDQDYCVTLYKGKLYPYTIVGSGTYDNTGEYITMNITYELFQDGWSPSLYLYQEGEMVNPYFTATLTLDPDGLPSPKNGKIKVKFTDKPTR